MFYALFRARYPHSFQMIIDFRYARKVYPWLRVNPIIFYNVFGREQIIQPQDTCAWVYLFPFTGGIQVYTQFLTRKKIFHIKPVNIWAVFTFFTALASILTLLHAYSSLNLSLITSSFFRLMCFISSAWKFSYNWCKNHSRIIQESTWQQI